MNLHLLEIVKVKRKDANLKPLLNIGTCGLHTVHNAFKHGAKASEWSIDQVLSSLYKIFDQSPSRRGYYEKLTSGIYPLQFCSLRWVENKLVGERAIEVWDNIVTVVKFWMSLPKSKQSSSYNKSYTRLKWAITDPLIKTKFKFFAAVAMSLDSFLMIFQTDNTIVLFLAQSIEEITLNYASSFLLKETLSSPNSCPRLSKIDFKNSAKQKRPVDVEVNVGFKPELSHLQKNGKVSTNQVLGFKDFVRI